MTRIVDLLVFDCDGVLVDTEVVGSTQLSAYLNELGLEVSPAECIRKFSGLSAPAIREKIRQDGAITPSTFAEDIRSRTINALAKGTRPCPGVAAFLDRSVIRRCVASSGSMEKITQSLDLSGLAGFFGENLFNAAQVENGKPAPDLFLLAAEKMGVTPECTIVVEDSVAGVQSAVSAGMTAVGFCGGSHCLENHGKTLRDFGALYVINDMRQLNAIVRKN